MARDKATPAPLTDALLRAIRESGQTVQALAKAAGVARMSVARFVAGERSLRLDKADRLAAYFGLELRATRPRRKDG
jgi:plasmid maintenance system antidote protein VapI